MRPPSTTTTPIGAQPPESLPNKPGQVLVAITEAGAALIGWKGESPLPLPKGGRAKWAAMNTVTGQVAYGGPDGVQISEPPYTSAEVAALPPSTPPPVGAEWQGDGKRLWLFLAGSGAPRAAALDIKTTALRLFPASAEGVSRNGDVRAYLAEKGTAIELSSTTAQPVRLFDAAAPAAVVKSVRQEGTPQASRLADSADSADSAAVSDTGGSANRWNASNPALTPDGATLYWATPFGVAGGWIILRTDTVSGKTRALTTFGRQQGTLPFLSVAPNGRLLLVRWRTPALGIGLRVLDLATQQSTVLLRGDAPSSVLGACFSPDSSSVAYSVHTYLEKETGDPSRSAYTLAIKPATTPDGANFPKVTSLIKGAIRPGCR